MTQVPVVFDCAGDELLGIVDVPAGAPDTALLIIVGGPQYRVGSHRQFVQLAEAAAGIGCAAMRFDVRGMGDAAGTPRSFEDIGDDIRAAIDALQRIVPSVRHVGLWGLCGGASAALLYVLAQRDPRIAGVALVNPWVRSETTQALTRVKHYYLQRLLQKAFWKKLFAGKVGLGAVTELGASLRRAGASVSRRAAAPDSRLEPRTLEDRMALGWQSFGGPILLLLSGIDYTAKEFLETVHIDRRWQANVALPQVVRVDVADADHTFSVPGTQGAVIDATLAWLRRLAGRTQPR